MEAVIVQALNVQSQIKKYLSTLSIKIKKNSLSNWLSRGSLLKKPNHVFDQLKPSNEISLVIYLIIYDIVTAVLALEEE